MEQQNDFRKNYFSKNSENEKNQSPQIKLDTSYITEQIKLDQIYNTEQNGADMRWQEMYSRIYDKLDTSYITEQIKLEQLYTEQNGADLRWQEMYSQNWLAFIGLVYGLVDLDHVLSKKEVEDDTF